jgi:RecB family endonuclease NucS
MRHSKTNQPDRLGILERYLYSRLIEKLIKKSLKKNPSLLEKGLRLSKGAKLLSADDSNIHLLMQDKNEHYVVVELKKGETEDGVVGQTLRYMGWVREHISKVKNVRGIILVAKGEISTKLEMAIKGLQPAQSLIKLKEIPITIDEIRDHSGLS